jgi:hypothetical protein
MGIASDKAGMQGAASPQPEREVPSPPHLSLPTPAAKQDFATTLGLMGYNIEHVTALCCRFRCNPDYGL